MNDRFVTTGLPGLDAILDGLRVGDNVVWRVDDVEDYRALVDRFVAATLAGGRRIVYIRFGRHAPLVEPHEQVTIHDFDANRGFEPFTVRLHSVLAAEGPDVGYVFDCLSDLLDAWATDVMIGNFFLVTCPYLYELDTVAYFALLRPSHSVATVSRIRATTQVLVDLHRSGGELYLHPLKADHRTSRTMFLPHRRRGEEFVPLTSSAEATALFARLDPADRAETTHRLDHWDLLFMNAAELAERAPDGPGTAATVDQLCRVLLGRDERILALARDHFGLADLLGVKARQLGTGFIGGKAVGMLLARAILDKDAGYDWATVTEPHDSWYVGADLYYSYIVHNGWWRLFVEQKSEHGYFTAAEELHDKLLHGSFPPQIRDDVQAMLEYFGQYPIIVRSSSLQEDGFGNAFAGKYDSVFLVNQGSPQQRYRQFVDGLRRIYASTMSEEALAYRRTRGLDREEEQMALLVQRVSGAYHGRYFFPLLAGVGVSYNTFVWHERLDPAAGMLRLVLGLGTRAVDRVEGDYPRTVALDHPLLVPHADADAGRFSQHQVDVLDIDANAWRTVPLADLVTELDDVPWHLVTSPDPALADRPVRPGGPGRRRILTFAGLLRRTEFPALMRRLLDTLERAYRYPVDVEFTAHVDADGAVVVNLVQCRPLQTKGVQQERVTIPADLTDDRVLFRTSGSFMGGSLVRPLRRVVVVHPERYSALSQTGKYEVARVIGRLNRLVPDRERLPTALLGPGRWGTSTPSLGVPVRFAEIRNVAVLGEVAFSAGGLMPELSFGSHFFQDLVEADIFYVALFPDADSFLNEDWLARAPNRLADLLPDDAAMADVITVVDVPGDGLTLLADILSQRVVCLRGGHATAGSREPAPRRRRAAHNGRVRFDDRTDAGHRLGQRLREALPPAEDVLVLGLPRGGVPVAAEVARALGADLDILLVHKLGVPFQPEFAMGAVGDGGYRILDEHTVRWAGVTPEDLDAITRRELAELDARGRRLRRGRRPAPVRDRTVVIVDDGAATGLTALAACHLAREAGARRVVVGLPVASREAAEALGKAADEVVCVHVPRSFAAVGEWYADFGQTSETEVVRLLDAARAAGHDAPGEADPPGGPSTAPRVPAEVTVRSGSTPLAGTLVPPAPGRGIVLFAHGSGSGRLSPRNTVVAGVLQEAGLGTLLFDLLTPAEDGDRGLVFDIEHLAGRLRGATAWVRSPDSGVDPLAPVGYFGASTGAAAALVAAAAPGPDGVPVRAVVSRGGRPDLAGPFLARVRAPTLLVVGSLDTRVLALNRAAQEQLRCPHRLAVVPGATHLFEEPGTLAAAAALARDWFTEHLGAPARV